MMNNATLTVNTFTTPDPTHMQSQATATFQTLYGRAPTAMSYAPGRVEVLGNHTDYNEGFVLSAAINMGTCVMAAPRNDSMARVFAANIEASAELDVESLSPLVDETWCNYISGVVNGIQSHSDKRIGFDALVIGSIPLGTGLSSSASLEVATALALSRLHDIDLPRIELAKICQKAEHEYAGVQCGLLDQLTSLFGAEHHLVMTDFRTLEVESLAIDDNACLVLCQTDARHELVDGEYNKRRAACESAAKYFATVLEHPVTALRDVSWNDFERLRGGLQPETARRAAHPIGESERVLKGKKFLEEGDLSGFGRLMFESHESSRQNFENSCEELDFIVDESMRIPGIEGARLTGGGFGGSAVLLTHPRDVDTVRHAISHAYGKAFGSPCATYVLTPADGARMLN